LRRAASAEPCTAGSPHFPQYTAQPGGQGGQDNLRNYFTFNLSSLAAGTVTTSATLEITRAGQFAPVTIEFFDVSPSAATLNAKNASPSAAIYDDLGTGTSYGAFNVGTGDIHDVLSFSLNAAALTDIQSHAGTFFSVGGALQTPGHLFSGSGQTAHLVIQTADPLATPEPSTLASAGTAALVLGGGYAWRRRKAGRASA